MELLESVFTDFCKHRGKNTLPAQVLRLMEIKEHGDLYKIILKIGHSKDTEIKYLELVAFSFMHSYLSYTILCYIINTRGTEAKKKDFYYVTMYTARNEISDLLHNQCMYTGVETISYIGTEVRQFMGLFYLPKSPLANHILRPAEFLKKSEEKFRPIDFGFVCQLFYIFCSLLNHFFLPGEIKSNPDKCNLHHLYKMAEARSWIDHSARPTGNRKIGHNIECNPAIDIQR
jgi:hypothetical protein